MKYYPITNKKNNNLLIALTFIALLICNAFFNTGIYVNAQATADGNVLGNIATAKLPDSYSSVEKGCITIPKQQGNYTTCGTFTATNACEASLIKNSGSKYTADKKNKNLKKKTYYYVRVRTYTKSGGKTFYSKWSSRKTVKTR